MFYTLKKYLLRARKHESWPYYEIQWRWTDLSRVWPVETMSLHSTAGLESRLRKLGMTGWRMPSTGMIAYDWLGRRLGPEDSLAIAGFRFDNWYGHPRELEKTLIAPIPAGSTLNEERSR